VCLQFPADITEWEAPVDSGSDHCGLDLREMTIKVAESQPIPQVETAMAREGSGSRDIRKGREEVWERSGWLYQDCAW
jgi:hypothetical protein